MRSIRCPEETPTLSVQAAERMEPREKGGSARLHLKLLKAARIVSTIPNGAMSFYRPSPCFRHPARNYGYLREVISKKVSSMSFQGSRLCPGIRKAGEGSRTRAAPRLSSLPTENTKLFWRCLNNLSSLPVTSLLERGVTHQLPVCEVGGLRE